MVIDVKKVIERLKRELNLKYDAGLARELGIERTYLGAMKSRGEFTGTGWNEIFNLCNGEGINVNCLVHGYDESDRISFRKALDDIVEQVRG